MSDFTGADVNAVLRFVKTLAPGEDAAAGERQLSILAVSLCAAARDCGVDPDHFIGHLQNTYLDMLSREMVQLSNTN